MKDDSSKDCRNGVFRSEKRRKSVGSKMTRNPHPTLFYFERCVNTEEIGKLT